MSPDEFDAAMRKGERFHALRVPDGSYAVIRVDGRSFSRLTERIVEKPFDERFHTWMLAAAQGLLTLFQGVYAFTESDEISILLPRATELFDREVEKWVSLAAARASSIFTQQSGELVEFDARIWVGDDERQVIDYFRWRQADATRCAQNGWCYWTLRKGDSQHAPLSQAAATRRMEGLRPEEKAHILAEYGIDLAAVPKWQLRGTGVYWATREKKGFNPLTGQEVAVQRRALHVDEQIPEREEYELFLHERIREATKVSA